MRTPMKYLLLGFTVGFLGSCGSTTTQMQTTEMPQASETLTEQAPMRIIDNPFQHVLDEATRIPTSSDWFEVLKLPNNIYAFYEPGHIEQVNSFLIVGDKKHLLYDTGMGIDSIKTAITDVMKAEGIPELELIVLNSHGHLDHIGGNYEFDQILAYNSDWRTRKLIEGIPAGLPMWAEYYSAVTPPPETPENFAADTMMVHGIDKDHISYIEDGHVIDLGSRQFKVILSLSHTDDSVILYDTENKVLFTGDVFHPQGFYVLNFEELAKDLEMLAALNVDYHYNTHGPQLIGLGRRAEAIVALGKIKRGEVEAKKRNFLGAQRTYYWVDDFDFMYMPGLLMY